MKLDKDDKYMGCSSGVQDVKGTSQISTGYSLQSQDGIFKMDSVGEKSRRYMLNIISFILINEILSVVGSLLLWL